MADGLSNVQMRIAAIQQRIGVVAAPAPAANAASKAALSADFASLLKEATTATNTGVDISSYPNGRIPESALVSIGNGERLAPNAAKAFTALTASAKTAGVSFGVNDSYRSYDQQVEMARTKGLYGKGGLAAVPGTSTHGKGLSVDLELDPKAQSWMQANASKFGYVNDVRGEPWHWTHKPTT